MADTQQPQQVVLSGDQYARQQLAAEMRELAVNPLDKTVPGGQYAHPDGSLHDAEGKAIEGSAKDAPAAAPAPTGGSLEGINFASDEAAEAAAKAGLSVASFDGHTPSGATGFTSADVKRLIPAA